MRYLSKNWKIKKNFDFEKRFKSSVLILKDEKLFRINETGKIIWEFLDKIPPEDIAKIISETKKVPFEKVRKQIYDFIKKLEEYKVVEIKS